VIPPDGPLTAGSVVEVGTPLSYADELQTSAVSTGTYVQSSIEDLPSIGGIEDEFFGIVEVVALTETAICMSWATTSPLFGGDEPGTLTVEGTVAAPLLELTPRNSMG
jgi:hypothetical protein